MSASDKKTLIYVNYSPYENSGKILDYLLENFENVCLFTIGFHNLINKKDYNSLFIYRKGKLEKTISLFQIPQTSRFVHALIPFRSLITFFEILFYSLWLKLKFKKIDIYFTVNAFTAWIGKILKSLGVVNKTIFWVWDYYPPIHENKFVMLMRYVYWQFDKISSHSDIVTFVNNRLLSLRRDIGIYDKNTEYPIVPIGTDRMNYTGKEKRIIHNKLILGFIGVLKKTQGIEIIFNNSNALIKEFGAIKYEIIGSGPDENILKKRAKNSKISSKFYGYLEGETFNDVLRNCHIGIATYTPDPGNLSQFGDPGKIKRYLSLGIPVITTDLVEISEQINKSGAGVVITYDNQKELVDAVRKILNNYSKYSRNAYKLSQRYYYRKIYPRMFNFK